LATSHIAQTSSDGHSTSVIRLSFPVTSVIGPRTSASFCRACSLMSERTSVDLPTPRGPTTATSGGGGAAFSVRSTRGTYCFWCARSTLRWTWRFVRPMFAGLNAFQLWRSGTSGSPRFRFDARSFFSALGPAWLLRCSFVGRLASISPSPNSPKIDFLGQRRVVRGDVREYVRERLAVRE
jgi:hypothetical protein